VWKTASSDEGWTTFRSVRKMQNLSGKNRGHVKNDLFQHTSDLKIHINNAFSMRKIIDKNGNIRVPEKFFLLTSYLHTLSA